MIRLFYIFVFTLFISQVTSAQQVLRIPSTVALSGSSTHMYVLSSTDGMVVFRAHGDSLIWLYNSDALLRRGSSMQSDARFAYLYGAEGRLTIVDPTVSQGLYSATFLPSDPMGVARVGSRLYIAMGASGLASISLSSPTEVDTSFETVPTRLGPNESILDVTSIGNRLFALGSTGTTYPFIIRESEAVQEAPVTTGQPITGIFTNGESFLLTTDDGSLFTWQRGGLPVTFGSVEDKATSAAYWNNGWVVRTNEGKLWHVRDIDGITTANLLRDNSSADNYFTVNKGNLWVSEFGRMSMISAAMMPVSNVTGNNGPASGSIRIAQINNMSLPFPQPVLASFALGEGSDIGVSWYVRHNGRAVPVKGNAMMWQPSNSNIGQNTFTVIANNRAGATDSTTFTVDIRQFNAPPRLTPQRQVSIPIDEEFRLQLTGVDPDGVDSELIRYSGVNLPDGIKLDAQTGLLLWTPNDKQLGRHVLQIITSDQYGASMSNEVILNVIRLRR